MSELSPRVRAIVEAGRSADDPTGEDRARVRGAVLRAIGAGAGGALGAASMKAAAPKGAAGAGVKAVGSGLAVKIGGTLGALVIAGAGLFAAASAVGRGDGLRAEDALSVVAAAVELPDPPAGDAPIQNEASSSSIPPIEDARGASIESNPARGGLKGKTGARAVEGAPASTLEEETKRLREARKALRSGNAEEALALLDEQSAAFASGELREERAAARVFALCQAGKASEARAAAQAFLRESPRSPLAGRVRGACRDNPTGE